MGAFGPYSIDIIISLTAIDTDPLIKFPPSSVQLIFYITNTYVASIWDH